MLMRFKFILYSAEIKSDFTISEVRRSMPNLNKLRGGKVGPGARPGQYGMGGAKYHNSESRLQQPPSRMMQGEIMSLVTDKTMVS